MTHQLPPLPDKAVLTTHTRTGYSIYGYTEEQMREYALTALAQRDQEWIAMNVRNAERREAKRSRRYTVVDDDFKNALSAAVDMMDMEICQQLSAGGRPSEEEKQHRDLLQDFLNKLGDDK